jgi:hypothetical protein
LSLTLEGLEAEAKGDQWLEQLNMGLKSVLQDQILQN